MKPEDHREVKWVISWLQAKFTIWGQIIFGMIVVGLAISSVGTQISAYFLVSLISALFLTSLFLSWFFKPEVQVTRYLPSPPTCGGECEIQIEIKNIGRRVLRNLEVFHHQLPTGIYSIESQSLQWIDWLRPGQSARMSLKLRIPRRGSFELPPVIVGTSFPTGLIRSIRRCGPQEILIVYPQRVPLPPLGSRPTIKFQPGGVALSSRLGAANEFLSTREYRAGDRMRDIHWKSSARHAKLIVKEYIEEYSVRVGLILDVELKRFEKHRAFETLISLGAGICEDLVNRQYLLDIFLNDGHHLAIHLGPGRDNTFHGLDMLSAIEGEDHIDFSHLVNRLKENIQEYSQLLILLKDWDPKRKAFAESIRGLSPEARIIIVRDRKLSLPIELKNIEVYHSRDLIGEV